jgi:hypothetical protein
MWLFTSFGFFSIVRKTDGLDLTIRSRTSGDLQRLRLHDLPQASEPEAQRAWANDPLLDAPKRGTRRRGSSSLGRTCATAGMSSSGGEDPPPLQ